MKDDNDSLVVAATMKSRPYPAAAAYAIYGDPSANHGQLLLLLLFVDNDLSYDVGMLQLLLLLLSIIVALTALPASRSCSADG